MRRRIPTDSLRHAPPVRLRPDREGLGLGGHAVAAAGHDALDDAAEELLGDGEGVGGHLDRVEEGVGGAEQLGAGGAEVVVAGQAAAHRAQQGRRHRRAPDAALPELDGVPPVEDGVAAGHLVRDVGEGRLAVHHLVQDAPQTPDVAGLAELHELGPGLVLVGGRPAADPVIVALLLLRGGRVEVDHALRAHVVGGPDLGLAVHVDRLVRLDGVGDAEVDELQPPLHQHEVRRLQVRVHDVVRVHRRQALQHLLPVVPHEHRVEPRVLGREPQAEERVKVHLPHFHELQKTLVNLSCHVENMGTEGKGEGERERKIR